MTKEKLLEYAKEKGIFVPAGASKEYLEAAIVRAALHQSETESKDSCFGFWEQENSSCMTCDFEKECSTAALGMDLETYKKKLDAADNPRRRFEKRSKKSKYQF